MRHLIVIGILLTLFHVPLNSGTRKASPVMSSTWNILPDMMTWRKTAE